jgi:chromosomal replication initiation ATPase DnaA
MSQIALPLQTGPGAGPARIVVGSANRAVFDALAAPATWPYRTALLAGPPRSGKSLVARWFAEQGLGEAIDRADRLDETELFHRWNRAQESAAPLLLVADRYDWTIGLPDLASRLGAALHLEIGVPDDEMVAALIEAHAAQRGLLLGEGALGYLTPRIERSFSGIERLVEAIDRLSLERKAAATLSIWRDALASVMGAEQPRLL